MLTNSFEHPVYRRHTQYKDISIRNAAKLNILWGLVDMQEIFVLGIDI